jgi:hypothetical protein
VTGRHQPVLRLGDEIEPDGLLHGEALAARVQPEQHVLVTPDRAAEGHAAGHAGDGTQLLGCHDDNAAPRDQGAMAG